MLIQLLTARLRLVAFNFHCELSKRKSCTNLLREMFLLTVTINLTGQWTVKRETNFSTYFYYIHNFVIKCHSLADFILDLFGRSNIVGFYFTNYDYHANLLGKVTACKLYAYFISWICNFLSNHIKQPVLTKFFLISTQLTPVCSRIRFYSNLFPCIRGGNISHHIQ